MFTKGASETICISCKKINDLPRRDPLRHEEEVVPFGTMGIDLEGETSWSGSGFFFFVFFCIRTSFCIILLLEGIIIRR